MWRGAVYPGENSILIALLGTGFVVTLLVACMFLYRVQSYLTISFHEVIVGPVVQCAYASLGLCLLSWLVMLMACWWTIAQRGSGGGKYHHASQDEFDNQENHLTPSRFAAAVTSSP